MFFSCFEGTRGGKTQNFAPKYSLSDFTNNLDNRTFQQNQKKKR